MFDTTTKLYHPSPYVARLNSRSVKKSSMRRTPVKVDRHIIIQCGMNYSHGYKKKQFRYNENQSKYREAMDEKNTKLVIAVGPSGTGKTSIACSESLEKLINDEISKIIITRPTVCVGNELGFLPGNLEEKMSPWIVPIYESFLDEIDKPTLDMYINDRIIEICPLSYIRGRTLSSCWIIADEMQNCSPAEMKTLLTRVGDNAKIIVTGDVEQCDLDSALVATNGLTDLINKVETKKNSKYTCVMQFTIDDVQRSDFVKYIIRLYSTHE